MAEAMLEEDYRSSHGNISEWCEDEMQDNMKQSQEEGHPRQVEEPSQEKGKGSEKRVAIQLPPKRRKISTSHAPKDVVEALNNSMSREERSSAIDKALISFDHQNQTLHDKEIEDTADISLVKMLVFLEFKSNFRRPPIKADMTAITSEISRTCEALEMVYRASSEAVGKSFMRVGIDLLQILVTLIDVEVKDRMESCVSPTSQGSLHSQVEKIDKPNVEPDSGSVTPISCTECWGGVNCERDVILKKVTKILGHYARVRQATKVTAHFPGLLGTSLNLINMPPDRVPWEARLSCLWTIANLACNTTNMALMMVCPGLINSLVSVGFQPVEFSDPLERTMELLRARSIATRALLNLSWPPENKIPLSENVALVKLLCQLAVERNAPFYKSRTIQDVLVQTRRNSLGTLRNLAAAPRRYKILMCNYEICDVLDALADAALHDNDERAVDLAYAAIHSLSIHDNANALVDRAPVVLAITRALLLADDSSGANSARSHASAIRLVLERSITPDMPSYPKLKELLNEIKSHSRDAESEIVGTAV